MIVHTDKGSPNHSARPAPPFCLVLHATATASLASPLGWLRNPLSRVSAHYLIAPDGETYQLVSEHRQAWHAGKSEWFGWENLNRISVGIELVNPNDGRTPYPDAQYAAAVAIGRQIVRRWNIGRTWVVRHLDISPGRKSDPAGFPWAEYLLDLYLPVPAPFPLYYAPRSCWARTWRPSTLSPWSVVEAGYRLPVYEWVTGQQVSGSTRWARTERGYIHESQLEAA